MDEVWKVRDTRTDRPALDVDDIKITVGKETRYLRHQALIPAGQMIGTADQELTPTGLHDMVNDVKRTGAQNSPSNVCIRYQAADRVWHETRQFLDVGETDQLIIKYGAIQEFPNKKAACRPL